MLNNKGVTLYLAILIMIVILAIALGLSAVLFSQIRTVKGVENSVIAFSAADSGIEKLVDLGIDATTTGSYSGFLDNGASWEAEVLNPGDGDCPADTENFCINSRGTYGEFQRAIQI